MSLTVYQMLANDVKDTFRSGKVGRVGAEIVLSRILKYAVRPLNGQSLADLRDYVEKSHYGLVTHDMDNAVKAWLHTAIHAYIPTALRSGSASDSEVAALVTVLSLALRTLDNC